MTAAKKPNTVNPQVGEIWIKEVPILSLPSAGPLTQMVRGQFGQKKHEYVLVLSNWETEHRRVSVGEYIVSMGYRTHNYTTGRYPQPTNVYGECVGYSNLVRILYGC